MITSITPTLIGAVALGGALGAISRFVTQHYVALWLGLQFPYGTLIANVLGCFAMGLISGYWTSHDFAMSNELRGLLVIGFLGAFTTFSAFSLDSLVLFQQGELAKALVNIGANLTLCLVAVFLGVMTTSR